MNCPICRSEMKPLFTGFYCPSECDRAPARPSGTEAIPFMWNGDRWYAQVVEEGDIGIDQEAICLWEREPTTLLRPASYSNFRRDPEAHLRAQGFDREYPGHKFGVNRKGMASSDLWVREMGQPILVRFFRG